MDVRSYGFDGDSVILTTSGGALQTVPRSRVDFEATVWANEDTSAGAEGPSPQVDGSAAAKALPDGEFLVAEIYSDHREHPGWNSRIEVYLRFDRTRYEVVGVERESKTPSAAGENTTGS